MDTSGTNQARLRIFDMGGRGKETGTALSSLADKYSITSSLFLRPKTLDYHVIKQASVLTNPILRSASISLPTTYLLLLTFVAVLCTWKSFPSLLLLSIYQISSSVSLCLSLFCLASFRYEKNVLIRFRSVCNCMGGVGFD